MNHWINFWDISNLPICSVPSTYFLVSIVNKPTIFRYRRWIETKKGQCGYCGIMYIRHNAARHRKNCQAGIICCPDCKEREDREKLKEELSACQHFLVDTETENGRHMVFNFPMWKLDTKFINEKMEEVFNKLISTAKKWISVSDWFFVMSKGENVGINTHTKLNLF